MPRVSGEEQRSATVSERARLVERLVGRDGILPAYAEDLASIRRRAAALQVKNRRMLRQVRELQTRGTSHWRGTPS